MPLSRSIGTLLLLPALLLVLAACQSLDGESFVPLSTTVELDPGWAARGETVAASLTGANTKQVSVTVAGVPAQTVIKNGSEFSFVVPQDAPAGKQPVTVELSSQTLLTELGVLGDDIVAGDFMLVVAPGTTADDLADLLSEVEFELLAGPSPLGADSGVCSGELVLVRVAGLSSGAALHELKGLVDGGSVWHSDPQSTYSSGAVDHLSAIGANSAHLRGLSGTGSTIAVVDTGVSRHTELGSRLLLDRGWDFVDPGTPPLDEFPSGGHGTPIAVLAAGSLSGVAPQAQVLPVRVCDAGGNCRTSDVLAGVCHAVADSQSRGGLDRLVLNLSLGGESPITSIHAALEYAVQNGTLVAASAGNQRQEGSPAHYPAAHDIDGVVAVAALQGSLLDEIEGDWKPASFSTRGEYVDIAAPGVDLKSGTSSGGYASNFTGTSYATALTSGALALWREARPADSSARIEGDLKAAAEPLGYPAADVGAGLLYLGSEPR